MESKGTKRRLHIPQNISSNKKVKPNDFSTQEKDDWSDARKKAYAQRNTNSYFYRFNKEGEKLSSGKWTDKETKQFMLTLKECGANTEWGFFSQNIPGRVGYTCSQFYRRMMERGWIFDANYLRTEGEKFVSVKTKQTSLSPEAKKQISQYGFVVIHDPSGVFGKNLPQCHKNATKEFKEKFLKNSKIQERAKQHVSEDRNPVILGRESWDFVHTFPDNVVFYGESKSARTKANQSSRKLTPISKKSSRSKRKATPKKAISKKAKKISPITGISQENDKWRMVLAFENQILFTEICQTENDALRRLDIIKMEFHGLDVKTQFDKKNYDLVKIRNDFIKRKTEIGVENAIGCQTKLILEPGEGNVISTCIFEDNHMYIDLNGYIIIKNVGNNCISKEQQMQFWNKWVEIEGKQIVADYKILRTASIEEFRKAPCEFTYDHMLCSHGVIDIQTFIKRQKQCPSSETESEDSTIEEEKAKIREIEKQKKISMIPIFAEIEKENQQKQKQQILIEQKQDHMEQQLQNVEEDSFFGFAEQIKVDDIKKRLSEIDEEEIL